VTYVDQETSRKVLALSRIVVANFTSNDWIELGTLTGSYELVCSHDRLLRSLRFGDEDYAGCALQVLMSIVEQESANLEDVERYVHGKFGGAGETISSTIDHGGPRIYFQPTAFKIPLEKTDPALVSAMMPFSGAFAGTYDAIQKACGQCGLTCERADNIWKESAVIQDIFGLIYRSFIVICDFTDKNPNVFYEAGIAHTLGKHVIPITQHNEDIPFDLRHHRFLRYLNNREGLATLANSLAVRLKFLRGD
jgi:AbiJ N-terminal domain 5